MEQFTEHLTKRTVRLSFPIMPIGTPYAVKAVVKKNVADLKSFIKEIEVLRELVSRSTRFHIEFPRYLPDFRVF